MRILFVDTYYQRFLDDFWMKNQNLRNGSYEQIKRHLLATCFGTSDFYSRRMGELGHDASDIVINDQTLQYKWGEENGLKINEPKLIDRLSTLPIIGKYVKKPEWVQNIALQQIKDYKPDVVYMQDLSILNPKTLEKVKKYTKLLVGQIACPLPDKDNLILFDLIISSFPHYPPYFRKMGIESEYLKLAFEKDILKLAKPSTNRIYDISFIGSFGPHHIKATKIFEEVAREIPIHIWGQGFEFLSPTSPLRKNFHRENCFGLDYYKVLAKSKIVINRHIDVAKGNANNMRMFEATGMGCLLITDKKKNLNDLFSIDKEKEIDYYESASDLKKKLLFYKRNDGLRKYIAKNGQRKTIKYHNYQLRMKELANILHKYLCRI